MFFFYVRSGSQWSLLQLECAESKLITGNPSPRGGLMFEGFDFKGREEEEHTKNQNLNFI